MLFPILGIVLAVMIALALRYRYLNKKIDKDKEDFYSREQRANATPKKDISNLPYLKIPMEKFPIGEINDPDITSLEKKLTELSDKEILNLTGKTNTDLKEEYGVPNFEKMQQIGENFNDLTVTLVDYASELMLHNEYDYAITVLEYGIVIKTDVSKNYTLLGDCYKIKNQPRRIATLKEQAEHYNGIMKDSIIKHLDGLVSEDNPEDFESKEDIGTPTETKPSTDTDNN